MTDREEKVSAAKGLKAEDRAYEWAGSRRR